MFGLGGNPQLLSRRVCGSMTELVRLKIPAEKLNPKP